MAQEQAHQRGPVDELPAIDTPDIPGLIEGRIVHFVLDHGPAKGEHRPAIIVKVWDRTRHAAELTVFTEKYDVPAGQPATLQRSAVPYSEEGALGAWHWIEKHP